MAKTTGQRSKHHGTLELRGKVYRARWEYRGRVFTRSTRTGNRREAERILEEFTRPFWTTDDKEGLQHLEAKVAGRDDDLAKIEAARPGFSLMAAWSYFHTNYKNGKYDQATMTNYEQWFWIFADWLKVCHSEIVELGQVTAAIAQSYAKSLLAGTTNELNGKVARFRRPVRGTTYNRHLNALALIWKTVAKEPEAKLGANPFTWDKRTDTGIPRITLRKGDKPHRHRDLSFQEVHKLLNAANGELRGVLAMSYYTGLRFKDCVLMRWDNVDAVAGLIVERSFKTDEEICARINPALRRILEDTVKTSEGYLFPETAATYNRGVNGRVELSKRLTQLFQSVGIKTSYKPEAGNLRAVADCTFHSLRHTFNSHLQRLGFDRCARQALMGHATAAMTAHYEHGYAEAPMALPDLLTCESDPSEDKLLQLRSLMATMSESELNEARSLVLAQQGGQG